MAKKAGRFWYCLPSSSFGSVGRGGCSLARPHCPTAGICPGTGSPGENESPVCSLVPCVYECVWWGSGRISNSQLFPRHGKEGGGAHHPGFSSEKRFLRGWVVLQLQPTSPGSPRVPAGWKDKPCARAVVHRAPLDRVLPHTPTHWIPHSLLTTSAQAGNPKHRVPAVCGPALEIPGPSLAVVLSSVQGGWTW